MIALFVVTASHYSALNIDDTDAYYYFAPLGEERCEAL